MAVVGVSMLIGTTMLVGSGAAAAAKPTFSQTPAGYLPATVGGRKVMLDASSTGGGTLGSCDIPADATITFAYNGNLAQEVFGGIWDCPVAQPNQTGTGFVAGLDAGIVPSGTPKLSRRELLTPPPSSSPLPPGQIASGATQGLKVFNVSVAGQRVQVFISHEVDSVKAGPTTFEIAEAEPQTHLRLTTTTPRGGKPLTYLLAMLKAGLGLSPRATPGS